MKLLAPILVLLSFLTTPAAVAGAQGEAAVIDRLVHEGTEHSQVWATLEYLSEEIGPRLTGSSGLLEANVWTRDEFRRLGLTNAHMRRWGEIPVSFDRGPSRARMVSPSLRELEFTTRSWSAGTNGPVRARVRLRPTGMDEMIAVADDLAGTWILRPYKKRSRRKAEETEDQEDARLEQEAIDEALAGIAIAGYLTSSRDELVHTSSVRGWRDLTMDTLPEGVDVQIRASDFSALRTEINAGTEVQVEVDLVHHFTEGPFPVFNTIADIPGTERPEEVVIFSGHLDSWDGPGSKGSQDNGTGSAVMLEAARILMDAGVQPKRTIRFILWGGEEQGLLGSRAYVESLTDEEKANISAVFVDDGGTGYQGGVVCIESMLPMLDAAIAPVIAAFPELEIENKVNDRMPRGGGSDHSSFNREGVPGFFWMEKGNGGREGKNYSFVHHTQHDTLRYVVPEYLIQSATCSAIVAYQLAEAETLLPRQPAGEPEPAGVQEDPTFRLTQGAFSGKWQVQVVDEDMPEIEFALDIATAVDGRLRGKMTGERGVQVLKNGVWNPEEESATFSASSDFGPLEFKVKIDAENTFKGSFDVGGRAMNVRAERVAAELSEASELAGQWKGVITSMDAEISMFLAVDEQGKVTGRYQSSQSDSPLLDGKWDAESRKLTFEYDYVHAGRLPVVAHLQDGKLSGTINENLEFVLMRVDDGAQASGSSE